MQYRPQHAPAAVQSNSQLQIHQYIHCSTCTAAEKSCTLLEACSRLVLCDLQLLCEAAFVGIHRILLLVTYCSPSFPPCRPCLMGQLHQPWLTVRLLPLVPSDGDWEMPLHNMPLAHFSGRSRVLGVFASCRNVSLGIKQQLAAVRSNCLARLLKVEAVRCACGVGADTPASMKQQHNRCLLNCLASAFVCC